MQQQPSFTDDEVNSLLHIPPNDEDDIATATKDHGQVEIGGDKQQHNQSEVLTIEPTSTEKRLVVLSFLVVLSMVLMGVDLTWDKAATTLEKELSREHFVQRQIENFQSADRNGLMLNIHLTHQGGTTLCNYFGRATGRAPKFACMGPRDELPPEQLALYPSGHPWGGVNQTERNIAAVRALNYTMVSWEYSKPPILPLEETDWENEHLLSVFVIRHPLERLLAGDGYSNIHWPDVMKHHNATIDTWWDFAGWSKTDNFALRILAGKRGNSNMTYDDFRKAQALMQRFSVIINIDCLGDSLLALADLVNVTLSNRTVARLQDPQRKHRHPPLEERYPYPEVYRHLQGKNAFDIKLYEWAKTQVLVSCENF